MLRSAAVAVAGSGVAMWALWAPAPSRSAPTVRARRWPWTVAAGAALAGVVVFGWTAGAVAGAISGICSWSMVAVPTSRRCVGAAESVAQFAAILTNQAQVSRTVVDALETAAPLATGPIASAAAQLVRDCRSLGVEAAAQHFAAAADTPAGEWLADVVAVAAASGGEWLPILGVLEAEAAETAATARRFHRRVAANLPQLTLAAVLGVAVAVGSALVSSDAWAWLAGPQGQQIGLVAAVLAVVICARPLSAVWEMLR